MKWSWKIARIAGIDLRIHATFVILLVWLALAYFRETGTVAGAANGVLFTLALFGSVVLHELGHALTARRFKVATRDITLLPIGGVAQLETIPDNPKQELQIALAGPAVTLLISAFLFVLLRAFGIAMTPTEQAMQRGDSSAFLVQLMWANVTLLVFNLLPAFPMDGGRVLRAALARRGDYLRATMRAARTARIFALVFGIIGLLFNPFLVLIALFVWLGAASESSATQMRTMLTGVPVERLMIRDIRTLAPTDTLDTALRHVLEGFQTDFPVVENGNVVGVVTRAEMLSGLAKDGRDALVTNWMEKSFKTATPGEPAEAAIARLRDCRCRTLPVVSDGRLAGVLTMDNVAEFVMFQSAVNSAVSG